MNRTALRTCLFVLVIAMLSASSFGAAGDILAKFPAPDRCPTGLAFDGKSLWLADRLTDLIYQIDPANGRVLSTLAAPAYQIEGLACQDDRLWALDVEEKQAFLLNPATGIVERTLPVPCAKPQGLAFDGRDLWIGDGEKRRLRRLSTEDGSEIGDFPLPSEDLSGLTFDGKYLWAADRIKDAIYMVCPKTGRVLLTFDSPFKHPRGLAYDGKCLWNVDYQSDMLYKLVPHDGAPCAATNPRNETLEYFHHVRNFGPGTLAELDIYLAVPRDLTSQKILDGPSFEPKPTEFLTDRWGQKVARFHFENVPAGKFVAAAMKVDVRLFKHRFFLVPEKAGELAQIPKEIAKEFLADGSKYCLADPRIRAAAKEIAGGETNGYLIARNIFDYVGRKVRYDMTDGWDTAPKILERGTGSCSEFSVAFIALCRAAGLPARYVGSVVVRKDDASTDAGVFHRWPEVFLPNYGWVPLDPSSGRGNFPAPADAAAVIGNREPNYLITTIGGGQSEYLGWEYNSESKWKANGPCKVVVERVGEWSPLAPAETKAEK
ncbi:MAG: transglutaminase [Pirellulales bacterium]|nr:transglutaminase [Pirellulales bacterium]